jgi:hypothetical protein
MYLSFLCLFIYFVGAAAGGGGGSGQRRWPLID